MSDSTLADKVQHIVVLMLENRSFDHMLGAMPGVEGVIDASGKARTDIFNLATPTDPNSKRYTPGLGSIFVTPADQISNGYGGPSHSFTSATKQLFSVETVGSGDAETTPYSGGAPQTSPPTNSGFVLSFIGELTSDMGAANLAAAQAAAAAGNGEDPVQEIMDVFTPDQLPAITTLAQQFAVCDHWFSELPGPTEPNRLFVHAGTSTGLTYNPWKYDLLTVPTLYDRIDAAGKDWAFYAYDLTDAANFSALVNLPQSDLPFEQFWTDAAAGKLPFYSFLCPRYSTSGSAQANSQHAPLDVRFGDKLIADVYQAVRNSPHWPNILLIITYDEYGGYHDHVTPPAVAAPDSFVSPNAFMQQEATYPSKSYLTEPDYTFDFTSLGFRVPAVLVSPFIARGTIDSTPYRHTSILRFVEDLIGQPPLTERDRTATSFAGALSLGQPRTDCPLSVPSPTLPEDDPELDLAAPTPKQLELVQRYTANLPGHPDTGGKVSADLSTNAKLVKYVQQRRQRAAWARSDDYQKARFELYRDVRKRWRWRLRDSDGDIIATSPDSWGERALAEQALERARFLSQMLGEPK